MDGNDIGVSQGGGDLGLSLEPSALARGGEGALQEHFDGHGSAGVRLLGAVDDALRAAVEFGVDDVAGDEVFGDGVFFEEQFGPAEGLGVFLKEAVVVADLFDGVAAGIARAHVRQENGVVAAAVGHGFEHGRRGAGLTAAVTGLTGVIPVGV